MLQTIFKYIQWRIKEGGWIKEGGLVDAQGPNLKRTLRQN